jgi:CheY-like chemotaxis protein
LFVDDDESVLMVMVRIARRYGFDFDVAQDGLSAIARLSENPEIGFVLTDHDMPGMTGAELFSYIRSHDRWKHLPVAVVTGGAGHELPKGLAIVRKPFETRDLLCLLVAHLGGDCPFEAKGLVPPVTLPVYAQGTCGSVCVARATERLARSCPRLSFT